MLYTVITMQQSSDYDLPDIFGHASAKTNSQLSQEGKLLVDVLEYAEQSSVRRAKSLKGKTYHVSSIGSSISNTYEKLRNSAEYTEDHLLLQRAIRRYLSRDLFLGGNSDKTQLVEEMVIELTQAGYIANDSVTTAKLEALVRLVTTAYDMNIKIQKLKVPSAKSQAWMLDTLSVECEWLFNNPYYMFAYAHFCYEHTINVNNVAKASKQQTDHNKIQDIYMLYYMGVLKNLLKADTATMRTVLMAVYKVPQTASDLKRFNEHFDELLLSKKMKQVNITVNRRSAPLRIIRASFFDETKRNTSVLNNRTALASLIRKTTEQAYDTAEKKLNNGVIKSIVFLVITKLLIGLAIEIPVDIWFYGSIIWLPLAINLLSPPLFLLFQRLTLRKPGARNTDAIQEYIAEMLYEADQGATASILSTKRFANRDFRGFRVAYTISSLIIFGLVIFALAATGFNPIQGVIFFVFMSTATFLGFRLSLIIKDIELVRTNQTFTGAVRDFIYTPFIVMGQWLSGKYAQINIISTILDLVIELPLKSVLRLVRQWVRFLDEKKETLV